MHLDKASLMFQVRCAFADVLWRPSPLYIIQPNIEEQLQYHKKAKHPRLGLSTHTFHKTLLSVSLMFL